MKWEDYLVFLPVSFYFQKFFFNHVRATDSSAEDQGGLEGLPTILCVAFILSKFLHTSSKHFTVDFFKVASQTALTLALKIGKRVLYCHSYDLGALKIVYFEQSPCRKVNLFLGCICQFVWGAVGRSMCRFQFYRSRKWWFFWNIIHRQYLSWCIIAVMLKWIPWHLYIDFLTFYVPVVNVDLTKPLVK